MTTNYIKLNELVGKIKQAYLNAQTNSTKAVLEDILPELNESKDEKIRKAIYGWINTRPSLFFDDGFSKEEMLAWLEKQGEQMSANKVEPKFKVGDWIVTPKNQVYQITSIEGTTYRFNNESTYWEICYCDEQCHFWTIEDAKDGDVLYSPTHHLIWIYKDNKHYYAAINLNYADGISFDGDIVIPSDVCPATKEQRDTLMKAMADAGYTFDFDKKELKKIEKKFNVGDEIKTANEGPLAITKIDEKGYWSEDLFICDFDDAAKWELVEQKPAWSEEDEKMVLGIEQVMQCASLLNISPDKIEKVRDWLKSLKERCTWKPSEEQMVALCDLNITGNISYAGQGQTLIELYNDLKKLKG